MTTSGNKEGQGYPPEIREWWENVLHSPKFIVAPMVDASELAWRMLSRRYKADLCFTPMLHSRIFLEDVKYQAENLYNCVAPEDRPLIVQFCGNDPDVLVKAATLAKPYCDGVDINLGCPQKIARNGHYGAFLMEDWDLIATIVRRIRDEVKIPISCKIRIFPDMQKTLEYAKVVEKAGCYMLTVHGRTREQKGMDTGLANWEYIKAVRNAVNIPVLANGNIQYLKDVDRCIEETGVNGVMSAEGNLHNPKLFAGDQPPVWEMGFEYLELVQKYPCPLSYTRGHLFKLYHHLLSIPSNCDLREMLGGANAHEELVNLSTTLKSRYIKYVNGEAEWVPSDQPPEISKLPYPPYLCQPYVRPPKKPQPPPNSERSENSKKRKVPESILATLPPGTQLSKNQIKKICKKPHKDWATKVKRPVLICVNCNINPQGEKCGMNLCKRCCKTKCYDENLDCEGHKIFIRRYREQAKLKNLDPSASDSAIIIDETSSAS